MLSQRFSSTISLSEIYNLLLATKRVKNLMAKKKAKPINHNKGSKKIVKESAFTSVPILDLIYNFQRAPDQWAARYILMVTAMLIRSAVGLGPYLGLGEKPINGDFEAQRHWMEITINLPINQWYFYDLPYWGLDYPPLTAFHLYLFGKIGSLINSNWFQLDQSRGIESTGIKNFMRVSSLISDLVIYSPALLAFVTFMGRKLNISRIDQIIIICLIMCQPSLILIDHGHFQYNSVMLGLWLFSLVDLLHENYVLASIWFITSIFFKQMALYYAPFIFFFILSKLFNNYYDYDHRKWNILILKFKFKKLIEISLAILATVNVILLPFIWANPNEVSKNLYQIITRVFPFNRGLFEDKVANFWCTTNILIKYRKIFTNEQLTKLSLILTILSILPSNLLLFYKNIFNSKFSKASGNNNKYLALIYGFAATAWGFYLFSFQVHEKTVLVPLIASTLLYCLNDRYYISITQWINNIATFSLYPLLKKDNLVLQYFVLLIMINWLVGAFQLKNNLLFHKNSWFWNTIFISTYLMITIYHIIDYYFVPPPHLPDLFVIINTTISFGCFSFYYLWLLYEIYRL